MKLETYIGKKTSNLTEREDIEWANFWIDRANTDSSDRILLIGDSTSRIIRSTFSRLADRPVDLLATSSSLHDELFINQVNAFFMQTKYTYKAIFVQLGHHAVYDVGGHDYQETDYKIFEEEYSLFVDYLKQYTSNVILETVLLTVKPYKHFSMFLRKFRVKETLDEEANYVKVRKNQIIQKIAVEKNTAFCDMCNIMLKEKFVHIDHIHYEKAAFPVIVKNLMKFI